MTTELLPPDADILDALDDSSDALVFIDEPVDLPDSINLSDEIFDQKLLTLMQVYFVIYYSIMHRLKFKR